MKSINSYHFYIHSLQSVICHFCQRISKQTAVMEDIMNVLRNIQKDLNEQKAEIQESGDRVTEHVTQNINKMLDDRFAKWEGRHQTLENKVEQQERRIQFLEREARKRNIVFFGISENDSSSYTDLEKCTIRFIKEYLHISIVHSDIQEVKRVGKRGEKPRPIIATFSTLGQKINIFKQKRLLKNTHYYINEDYPRYILEKRKELQEQAKYEREKGNKVMIKYDKLVIQKSNNKRALPTSPENTAQTQEASIMLNNKKNKISQPNTAVRRSNSVSEGVLKPGILNFLVSKNTLPDQDSKSDNNHN